MAKKPPALVILGPTASGKSALAVQLAKKFNGEIISADSRQVYKGLDIGSGKITTAETQGVPHHLLDVISPKKQFSVADYQKLAYGKIEEILNCGKLPIICGGTGFYIQAIVDSLVLPAVPPNPSLRAKLAKLSVDKLFSRLKKLDPKRASGIDSQNPHRLIRAIEIATALGKVPSLKSKASQTFGLTFPDDDRVKANDWLATLAFIQLGIDVPPDKLQRKIRHRLLARIKSGMVREVRDLRKTGVSWKRLDELGLEYRYVARHLRGQLSHTEMIEQLERAIWHYAKRQLTWFHRDKRIKWIQTYGEAIAVLQLAKLGKTAG